MKRCFCILVALLILGSATGCGKPNDSSATTATTLNIEGTPFDDIKGPISLVIIVGRHANAGLPTADMLADAKGLIVKSFSEITGTSGNFSSKANLNVIVSDGFPTEETSLLNEFISAKKNNQENVPAQINSNADSITQLLVSDSLMAKEENVDLLNALDKARVLLNGKENKYILVLDTGITTTGIFDMTQYNIMDGDAKTVADTLPQGQFPDLTGITVIFNGIGNLPNTPINSQTKAFDANQEAKKALKNVWIEILTKKCNAALYKNDISEATPGIDQPYLEDGSGYPYVKTVAFPLPPSPEPTPPPKTIETVYGTSGFFKGNSIKFEDEKNAKNLLNPIATSIAAFLKESGNEDEMIYVIGSIANTRDNLQVSSNQYSAGRADRVRGLFLDMLKDSKIQNIEKRIIAIDAGTTEFSWRKTNEFSSGAWSNTAAQNNRVVAVISSNSIKAQEDGLKKYID